MGGTSMDCRCRPWWSGGSSTALRGVESLPGRGGGGAGTLLGPEGSGPPALGWGVSGFSGVAGAVGPAGPVRTWWSSLLWGWWPGCGCLVVGLVVVLVVG